MGSGTLTDPKSRIHVDLLAWRAREHQGHPIYRLRAGISFDKVGPPPAIGAFGNGREASPPSTDEPCASTQALHLVSGTGTRFLLPLNPSTVLLTTHTGVPGPGRREKAQHGPPVKRKITLLICSFRSHSSDFHLQIYVCLTG